MKNFNISLYFGLEATPYCEMGKRVLFYRQNIIPSIAGEKVKPKKTAKLL